MLLHNFLKNIKCQFFFVYLLNNLKTNAMNPLKILAAFLLLIVISACNSDALEMSKFNSTDLLKDDSSKEDDGCETAFAKFDPFCKWNGFVFSITKKTVLEEGFGSLEWTNNKWGWATNIPDDHNNTHSFNLWAGAAHHDTDKGTLVGEVEYSRTNNSDLRLLIQSYLVIILKRYIFMQMI